MRIWILSRDFQAPADENGINPFVREVEGSIEEMLLGCRYLVEYCRKKEVNPITNESVDAAADEIIRNFDEVRNNNLLALSATYWKVLWKMTDHPEEPKIQDEGWDAVVFMEGRDGTRTIRDIMFAPFTKEDKRAKV